MICETSSLFLSKCEASDLKNNIELLKERIPSLLIISSPRAQPRSYFIDHLDGEISPMVSPSIPPLFRVIESLRVSSAAAGPPFEKVIYPFPFFPAAATHNNISSKERKHIERSKRRPSTFDLFSSSPSPFRSEGGSILLRALFFSRESIGIFFFVKYGIYHTISTFSKDPYTFFSKPSLQEKRWYFHCLYTIRIYHIEIFTIFLEGRELKSRRVFYAK